ncbi:MAG: MMPL family transporter [Verrucomicrobiota bacterium]|nr:MMPL family transporter [Verrucomicrobiota bacterium]
MKHVWAERWLGSLAMLICRWRSWFIYPQLGLAALCVLYTISELSFHKSRSELVGAERRYHRNFLEYKRNFQSQDAFVTLVESGDPEKNQAFIERLGARLLDEPHLFRDVFYKGDFRSTGRKSLQLVKDNEELQKLDQTLGNLIPRLERFNQSTNLVEMLRGVNRQFRKAGKEGSSQASGGGSNAPLMDSLPMLTGILDYLRSGLLQPNPLVTVPFNGMRPASKKGVYREYIQFNDGHQFILTALPVSESKEKAALEKLRLLVREVQSKVPGVNVGVTGKSVLELDEMRQSRFDTTKASVISLTLILVIFLFGYRQIGRPIKATLCLLVGLAYTMGFTTLVVGHLNILTIAFVPMLVGLAIDFGVHLITRYEEELYSGCSNEEAIRVSLVSTGKGIFLGCFTTSGAFLAMGITEFKGIREMGIITGGGMLLSLIPMMSMLPALLLRGRRDAMEHRRIQDDQLGLARMQAAWLERPRLVIGMALAGCALALTQIPKVQFDYNLLNLQTHGLEAVNYEHKLIQQGEKSLLFGAVIAESIEEALALESELERLPSVASVESMAAYLNAPSEEKIRWIESIRHRVDKIQLSKPDTGPVDVNALRQSLVFMSSYAALAIRSMDARVGGSLKTEMEALEKTLLQLRKGMQGIPEERLQERLSALQSALYSQIHGWIEALQIQETQSGLYFSDLPQALKSRFVGRDGRLLLQVYPRSNVWERVHQESFLRDLRSLDPDDDNDPVITGTPVQLYEYTELLKLSYQEAAVYALVAIVLILLLHFRSFLTLGLALLPVGVGSFWLLGCMGFLQIPFNPANIMTLPLVIGIGVTNGIHVLNRYHEESFADVVFNSTGKAVLISALTTMAGFGSLMFARHQGIASLGYVMSIGVGTCMLAGLCVLPCLLKWFSLSFHKKAR